MGSASALTISKKAFTSSPAMLLASRCQSQLIQKLWRSIRSSRGYSMLKENRYGSRTIIQASSLYPSPVLRTRTMGTSHTARGPRLLQVRRLRLLNHHALTTLSPDLHDVRDIPRGSEFPDSPSPELPHVHALKNEETGQHEQQYYSWNSI